MVKQAAVAKAEKLSRLAGPAGEKIVKESGEVVALSAHEIKLVMKGWELTQQIEALQESLDAVKQELLAAHGGGVSLHVKGVCKAILADRESVKIVDPERLRALLGDRFADLVREEAVYKPEPRLVELACDGDHPLQPSVAACLAVARSQSVSYRAERQAKEAGR